MEQLSDPGTVGERVERVFDSLFNEDLLTDATIRLNNAKLDSGHCWKMKISITTQQIPI